MNFWEFLYVFAYMVIGGLKIDSAEEGTYKFD